MERKARPRWRPVWAWDTEIEDPLHRYFDAATVARIRRLLALPKPAPRVVFDFEAV